MGDRTPVEREREREREGGSGGKKEAVRERAAETRLGCRGEADQTM